MKFDLSINPEKKTEEIVSFIKSTMKQAGFSDVVLGLSGGIDSATSCALAVRALGAHHVFPILLPYDALNNEGEEDAKSVIASCGIPGSNVRIVNIQPFVDPIATYDNGMDEKRKGNIMARVRMIVLMDMAKKRNALVLGTENKTEHLLGYFTRFGDEASDIEPIRTLYKSQVRQVATYLQLPEKILTKSPTAGLWHGQTDEGEFGFTYDQADTILYALTEQHANVEALAEHFSAEVTNRIVSRMKANEFKHHLPYSL